MREIRVKAWDTWGKQMCEWKLHQNPNVTNDVSFMFVGENGFCYPWEHPDLIKLLFTGLKDKNGKKIYEGDVVKFHYFYEALGEGLGVVEAEKEITGHIVFEGLGLWFAGDSEENSGYLLWYNGLHEESFEVIGNIHENKELL